jgi:hypothetical protein
MSDRLFTLEEANGVLPLVRAIVRDAVRRYGCAKEEIRKLGAMRANVKEGHPVTLSELQGQDSRIELQLNELRRLLDELEALGCRLRDYERGVVDFPAAGMDGEHFYYWCWIVGDPTVCHWHREEESFDQRHPVGAPAPH